MKILSVSGIPPENAILYVGELRAMQFYRRSLDSTWTSRETILDFCETTIQLAVENLILHKVVISANGVTKTKILFFFNTLETADFLTCNEGQIQGKDLGYLEKRIVQIILNRPGYTMADYNAQLFHGLLGNKKYASPGKVLINNIVRENLLHFWSYTGKTNWVLGEKMDMVISETLEEQMVAELNSVVRPIIEERNRNKEFRLFSERLYGEIEEQMRLREQSD